MYCKKRVVEPVEEGGVEQGESTSDVYDDDDSLAASVGTFDNPTSLVLPSGISSLLFIILRAMPLHLSFLAFTISIRERERKF